MFIAIPYSGFIRSARCMTVELIRRQVDTVWSMINEDMHRGWVGHECALCSWGACLWNELVLREVAEPTAAFVEAAGDFVDRDGRQSWPAWLRDIRLQESHRSYLRRQGLDIEAPADLPYLYGLTRPAGGYLLVRVKKDR